MKLVITHTHSFLVDDFKLNKQEIVMGKALWLSGQLVHQIMWDSKFVNKKVPKTIRNKYNLDAKIKYSDLYWGYQHQYVDQYVNLVPKYKTTIIYNDYVTGIVPICAANEVVELIEVDAWLIKAFKYVQKFGVTGSNDLMKRYKKFVYDEFFSESFEMDASMQRQLQKLGVAKFKQYLKSWYGYGMA